MPALNGKPHARIQRTGRWCYDVMIITENGDEWGRVAALGITLPWSSPFRWTAQLKADRLLRQYQRAKGYESQPSLREEGGSS